MVGKINYFRKYRKSLVFTSGFVLSILIGAIRYLTGSELALSLLYLIPIFVVTLYVGRWAGIIMSVTSASSLLTADSMIIDQTDSDRRKTPLRKGI